ncbi:MAG: hypothetical protein IID16_10125 [Candidatus Marinimicrobia bacterium]|nr:hypothetical protein [Candidatus Neomarinimicrobiota bacterium]
MYLFDDNCILRDKVEANPDWLGGDNGAKKSMERNGHTLEWYTYDGSSFGSPRQTNGRDLLVNYRPLVDVSSQSGISGGGSSPSPQNEEVQVCSQENLLAPTSTPVVSSTKLT